MLPSCLRACLAHADPRNTMPEKVALIGSGNWGSAIATKLGKNALEKDMFDKCTPLRTCPQSRQSVARALRASHHVPLHADPRVRPLAAADRHATLCLHVLGRRLPQLSRCGFLRST